MLRSMLYGLLKIIKFLRDNNVKFSKKLLFLIPIAYFLFPFDLIGDFFPIAGQLDDIAVFVVMWPILKKLLADYDPGEYRDSSSSEQDKDTIDIDQDDYEFK